jgi:hypothetical protein
MTTLSRKSPAPRRRTTRTTCSSARYPFKLRRLALKAHPDNRAHAAKWLQSVAHLGPRWIIGQALARTELARGVA